MENCDKLPNVKGWRPFKSVQSELDKTEKQKKEKEAFGKLKTNKRDLVEVPKGWKAPAFTIDDNPYKRLFCATEVEVLFPSKLNVYLKEVFPTAQKALAGHFIKAELILNEGSMTASTTSKTFDPAMILRAKSVMKLLARYVPVEEALRVLEDGVEEDIIAINHHKKDTFHRRRGRIMEPTTVDLIHQVLDVKIFVAGKTVAAIGTYSRLDKVRSLVLDCMDRNIHPIYTLKRLQLIATLSSMPEMAGRDWKKFFPPPPKKPSARKKPHKVRVKGEYEAFPPARPETKVDQELAEGLFHLKYVKERGRFKDPAKEKAKKEAKKAGEENQGGKKRAGRDDGEERPSKKRARKDDDDDEDQ